MTSQDNTFVYIEFAGMPGVGKTSIARITEKKLLEEGYGVATSADFQKFGAFKRHFMPILYLFADRETFVALLAGVAEFFRLLPKGRTGLGAFHGVFTRYMVRNFLVKEMKKEVYIIDDGTICRFFVSKAAEHDIALGDIQTKFLFLKKGTPIVILVRTPEEVAVARVLSGSPEGREYMFSMSKEEIREFYRSPFQNSEVIITALQRESDGKVTVLEVDGTASPKENAERIIEKIEGIFPPSA